MKKERTPEQEEVIALLRQNISDTFSGDFWPWMQALSAVIFIGLILAFEPEGEAAVFLLGVFAIFNCYAMYKTYQKECES